MKRMFFHVVFLSILLLTASTYPLPAGLIAYYPFDNDIKDYSGNNNNGTLYGNTVWMTGHAGKSLYFDGSTNYISVPNSASLTISNQLTVSAWIRPEKGSMWYRIVGRSNDGQSQNTWLLGLAMNGGVYFGVFTNSGQNYTDCDNDVQLLQWNHLVGVWNGTTLRAYLNGVLQPETVQLSETVLASSGPLLIGQMPGGTYKFQGAIDEIMIFNRGLSDAEVKSLFTSTQPANLYKCLIPVPSPSYNRRPILNWHRIPGAGAYGIQIDTTTSFSSPLIKTTLNDTSYKILIDLPIATIFWQITAGINDTLSYHSEIGSFIVEDPRVPLLIPVTPKETLQKRPVFSWHPVTGAASYMFQACGSNNFSNLILIASLADTVSTPISDLPVGPVFWRVKSDLVNTWSEIDSFYILTDSIPFLIRFNGAIVKSSRPVFNWRKVSNAATYRIETADNPAFGNILTTFVVDTFFCYNGDLKPGMWYWRVSCSRNYNLFSLPDSLVVAPLAVIENGNALHPVFSQGKLSGGRACELSVYSLSGIRIVKAAFENQHGGVHGLLNDCGKRLAKGVYLIELRKNGLLIGHQTYLQR